MRKLALGLILLSAHALLFGANSLSVETGVSFARITGTHSPSWEYVPKTNDSSWISVSSIHLRYRLTERWSASLGYARYSDIKSTGSTGTAPLQPGDHPTGLIVAASGKERINEVTADLRYSYLMTHDFLIEVGPTISQFTSRVRYQTASTGISTITQGASFRMNDFRLGALVAARIRLDPRWSLSATYRFANPLGHQTHQLGVSVGYRF